LINCSRAEDLYRSIKGKFKFDRIVADVPCSGDGTFRKFSHLWRLFRPRVSLELHLIQLQIAKASALMLKAGGRMIYSTCSINPLEDEAVVAALLLYCNGKLKLVDVEKEGLLPGLKKRAGISDWTCDDDIFTIGEADDEARQASKSRLTPLVPSMYPPAPSVAAQLHLDRCVRILPHDQDTGGFFVAVLEMVCSPEDAIPIVLPPVLSCDLAGKSSSDEQGESAPDKKKNQTGISEASTLQTFKSLGFNAKSRQKEKGKKNKMKCKEEDTVSMKLDTTHCTLYESLGDSFDRAKQVLHFKESDLGKGLEGAFTDDVSSEKVTMGQHDSPPCYLVIATTETIPEAIEKVELDAADGLTKEEEQMLKLKKLQQKSRDSNGIFGSKSTGWVKVQAVDNEEDEEEKPYKKVQMVSKCVESSLRTWARSDMVIQAGVTVCHHQESTGTWRVEPDGARAFLPHIEPDRVMFLSFGDFSFFLRQQVEEDSDGSVLMFQNADPADGDDDVSIGVEYVSSEGDVISIGKCRARDSGEAVLSSDARQMLWTECVQILDSLVDSPSSSLSLIIGIAPSKDRKAEIAGIAATVEGSQTKRRMSKAEKKATKKDSKNGTKRLGSSTEVVPVSGAEDALEKGMALVLTVSYNVVDGNYEGIRLSVSTPEDICSSYLTAFLSLKI
jgi:16S rRNA methyltransferase RsmB/F